MTKKQINSQVSKFNTLASANSFRYRAKKGQIVIQGCDGLFWVCSMAFGERLIKGGYEAV
jgi:hypothetical protein